MGLFDMGGGGVDIEALMRMLNPMGSAQAAEAVVPQGVPTPEQILQSRSATQPINDMSKFITPGATSGLPPINPPLPPPQAAAPPPTPQDTGIVPPAAAPSPVELAAAPPVTPSPTLDDLAVEQSVGAALTGESGTSGATDMSAQKRTAQRPNLAEVLKGTAMPKQPELQRIGSPAAPRPTGTIKGGELLALLTALGGGGGGRQLGGK